MRFIIGILLGFIILAPAPGLAKKYQTQEEFQLYKIKQSIESGDCTPVMDTLTNPKSLNRPNSTLYFYQGLCLLQNNEAETALEKFNQAVELDPTNVEALNNIGIIYSHHLEEYNKALEIYKRIIQLSPKRVEFRINRVLILDKLGSYQEAIKELQKILKINPNHDLSWYLMGLMEHNLGNYKNAITRVNRAIWLNPSLTEAYTLRGIIRINKGHHTPGCNDLKKAIDQQSPYAQLHFAKHCI